MARGSASGRKVAKKDVPIIMGMIARGDRHHDIAAWFGLNQGRIKDTQDGKYGSPHTTSGTSLPPAGPPGIKGRLLRAAIDQVAQKLKAHDLKGALEATETAVNAYDADDP